MSEEIKAPEGEQKHNQFIDKAKAGGWKPIEEFDGDPDQWVDAKEFVGRAPLYESNRKLKKQVSELSNTIHELKGHMGQLSEAAYNRAMRELTAQRDEAIDNGDKETVKAIDKQMKATEAAKITPDNTPPAIKAWEEENGKWFYADDEISTFGISYAEGYLKKHPGQFEQAMDEMEKAVKRAFPDKFENPKRKDPPHVESGGKQGGSKTFTKSDLNDEQRKVMNMYVRQGVMTEEQYIKDLVEIGVLGGKK